MKIGIHKITYSLTVFSLFCDASELCYIPVCLKWFKFFNALSTYSGFSSVLLMLIWNNFYHVILILISNTFNNDFCPSLVSCTARWPNRGGSWHASEISADIATTCDIFPQSAEAVQTTSVQVQDEVLIVSAVFRWLDSECLATDNCRNWKHR